MKVLPLVLVLAGCNEDLFPNVRCEDGEPCTQYVADDPQALQDGVNSLDADSKVVLGKGTFVFDNQVTLRADGITFVGQGSGVDPDSATTVLDFSGEEAQTNGVDVVGDGFTIEGLTILDAKKDGLRIEDSDRIVIRDVEATWTNENDPQNGAYGLYPVRVSNVLVEDSTARNAADAGIYVGQCAHAIVRNNVATGNVAGIEIENTQYADVYGNVSEGNTGGLLIFDLPGNPIIGHDIVVHDNEVTDNNRPNFAQAGTVMSIPAGTGTFVMASRRVEIRDNTYANNGTADIAVLSGLAFESDPAHWALDPTSLTGDWEDLGLETDPGTGAVLNFRSKEIWVHDNAHSGSGTLVDAGAVDNDCLVDAESEACTRPIGVLLQLTYGTTPVDEILYDTIGESGFSATVAGDNSNDNQLCAEDNGDATFASLNLPVLAEAFPPQLSMLYRPASPFAPFDCTFTDGLIAEITVEAP